MTRSNGMNSQPFRSAIRWRRSSKTGRPRRVHGGRRCRSRRRPGRRDTPRPSRGRPSNLGVTGEGASHGTGRTPVACARRSSPRAACRRSSASAARRAASSEIGSVSAAASSARWSASSASCQREAQCRAQAVVGSFHRRQRRSAPSACRWRTFGHEGHAPSVPWRRGADIRTSRRAGCGWLLTSSARLRCARARRPAAAACGRARAPRRAGVRSGSSACRRSP